MVLLHRMMEARMFLLITREFRREGIKACKKIKKLNMT
ncbi:hypothetical protein C4J92_3675 [Pseudomonas sp. R3-18-08]|nr:hypothetical protein C4J92_3675 [Pseudomonas sp. R3-18-08]